MNSPVIAFRTDASLDIGTGHVMRCLTLADAFRERGAECRFVCRAHNGHLADLIRSRGYDVFSLPPSIEKTLPTTPGQKSSAAYESWLGVDWETDCFQTSNALAGQRLDWLIVDHYGINALWECRIRPICCKLMVIDDLADRTHDCDILLDQTFGRHRKDYSALVPSGCIVLVGSKYSLLRPEFAKMRPFSIARREKPVLRRLLVTLGGVDRNNATGKVLEALNDCSLPEGCGITVVLGSHAPWFHQIRHQAAAMPFPTQVLVNVKNMARLMAESDLAIGAAGGTSWERCSLGLPAVVIKTAPNQEKALRALSRAGAIISSNFKSIKTDLSRLFSSSELRSILSSMSKISADVTDGLGTSRVLSEMFSKYAVAN